ncbi:MAG TPA: sialidase family protein [Puia sp.]|nr:sialidase family protein [Puia sp.]
MLNWRKLGRIFDPTEHRTSWMYHYAQNPNVLELEDRLRIYFTCRPQRDQSGNCVSNTAYADFEKRPPFKLMGVADSPVMELGGPGDFDEFGIMPGSLVRMEESGQIWLYYVGWTRMQSVPYKWSNGLAISKDNGRTFQRYSKGPVMGATFNDPYLQACPRVMRLDKSEFIMWYNSGTEWNLMDGHHESVYITRFATSADGVNWSQNNRQVIPTIVPKECQTSASFISFGGKNHIFFSYRHGLDFRNKENGYRIGYAYGDNFTDWTRKDELSNLTISDQGWDSEMVCYPHVIEIDGKIYLFYCGNNFGQNGFGVAVLDN